MPLDAPHEARQCQAAPSSQPWRRMFYERVAVARAAGIISRCGKFHRVAEKPLPAACDDKCSVSRDLGQHVSIDVDGHKIAHTCCDANKSEAPGPNRGHYETALSSAGG